MEIKRPAPEITTGQKAKVDSIYKSGSYTAIIPAGFTVSNEPGESSIENGLVVKDGSENEWVWIPVSTSDINLMYNEDIENDNVKEYTLYGTDVKTTYKSITAVLDKTLSRTTPGTTTSNTFREPDVVSMR